MNSPLVNNQLIECVLNETRRILNEEGVIMATLKDMLRGSMEGGNDTEDEYGTNRNWGYSIPKVDNSNITKTATTPATTAATITGQGLKPVKPTNDLETSLYIRKSQSKGPDKRWNYNDMAVKAYGKDDYGGMCGKGAVNALNQIFGLHVPPLGDGNRNIVQSPLFTHVADSSSQIGFPQAQNGDMAIFGRHKHACVFIDGQWVSDTVQTNFNPYRNSNERVSLYRPNSNNQA